MSQPGSNNPKFPDGSQFPGQPFNPLEYVIPPNGLAFAPGFVHPVPFIPPNMAPIANQFGAPSAATTPGSSASDWAEYQTEQGQTYYHNKVTQTTQWTKPPELMEASQKKPNSNEWVTYNDKNTGRPYYYNTITCETVWTIPQQTQPKDPQASTSPPRTTTIIENQTTVAPSEIPRSRSPILSKAESIQIFKELLTESGVDVDWDWNRTMKKIIRDDRYKVLKSMKQKTDVFNEYVNEKRDLERDVRREREKKTRQDFLHMLSELNDLTSRTNYHTIIQKIEPDPRYAAVRESDRHRIFEEFLLGLEKKEKEERIQKIEQASKEFRAMLERKTNEKIIGPDSQYRKNIDKIQNEESFKMLDEYDRVKIWKDYFGEVAKKQDEMRAQERIARKKQEKENRADLWDLFLVLQKQSKIDVLSSWKEIKPIIQNDDSYKRVDANTSGPNCKELFSEFLIELEKRYKRDKRLFKTMLKENEDLSVHIDSVYDDWIKIMKSDARTMEMDADNVKILFEENVDKAKQRAKKKRRNVERFKKMLDEIFSHLADVSNVVYDVVLPQMQARSCFEKIKSDQERRSLFEEHLASMRDGGASSSSSPSSSTEKRKRQDEEQDAPDAKRVKVDEIPAPQAENNNQAESIETTNVQEESTKV
ncbi:pre-mRNA-processing protein [Acrasis kona]|uniref:Pre-mRNA-processing protein n=1 Tax=Acrasis kona TaxID=1008807 RepID=A0AAW2Z628_9EUKA